MNRWRTRRLPCRDQALRRTETGHRSGAGTGEVSARWGVHPPVRVQGDLPVWRWQSAPAELITRRQMRAAGLAPGGSDPVGLLEWAGGRRWAALWDREQLAPKRTATPAQLGALDKAMAARRWCGSCGSDVGYCIPTSLGCCVDCAEANHHPTSGTRHRRRQRTRT